MKKLIFSTVLFFVAIAIGAQTTFIVGNFTYTVTDEENHKVSIAKADEVELTGALVIPSSVTYEAVTYAVTSVKESGFYGTGITSVTIPASVMNIGNAAFQACGSLSSITIEDSETPLTMAGSWYERPLWSPASTIYIGRNLTLTGEDDYPLTYDVTSVEFGPKVTTINPYLFSENSKLENLTIGSGVTTIGEYAFNSCGTYWDDENNQGVEELVVTMGSKVTSIGTNAFHDCPKLKAITLPSTLTTIGNSAFNGTGLTSISIPASVMTIGNTAFNECGSMSNITIEDSETPLTMPGTWYERPFWNTATTIYIGRNLTLTGGENNPILYEATSVEFGPKVTTINPALFYTNTKLESITIGSGVTTIGESAFYSCGTYWDDENNQGVEELVVTMGNNVTSIGATAFQACDKLKSITLPSKLTTIGNSAFNGTGLTSISIPASVMTIGDAAFGGCNSMTSVTIEDSETPLTMTGSWYERPFWNTATSIYLGRNVTLTEEVNPIFVSATSVEFGPQVTEISAPISGLLTSVKAPWLTPITIAEGIFNETELENATLWVPGGTMDAYEAANNWKEFANKEFASFVVSITASAHGTLAVADISSTNGETATTLIDRETDAVFTVTPATGYELKTFTVNGEDKTPTEGSYTVSNLLADQTVVAGFTPISYTLTYNLAGGSVASANPASYTIESAAITLTNPTKTGFDFAGWTGTGLDAATKTVTIATGSTGNRSYTATWTKAVYSVTITGAGVTADNMAPEYGDDVVITIADDPDRTLNTLTVNGADVTGYVVDGKYTIENVSANVVVVATFNSTKEFIAMAHSQQTFCCSQDLDFSEVSGLKAYIASGYDKTSGQVLLTRVESVPAGTGLLLAGTEGVTYKVPYATSNAFYVNLLKPVTEAQTVPTTDGAYTNFLYGKVDDVEGFFKSSGSGTVAAGKAYLQLPTAALPARVKGVSFVIDDELTPVQPLTADGDAPASIFDLNGRKMVNGRLPKGVYIINGKKVMVK